MDPAKFKEEGGNLCIIYKVHKEGILEIKPDSTH
jgi:hypothetical protein